MYNFNFSLNENQTVAAQHISGPMMVLAGPGSGKTAVITARAAKLATNTALGINLSGILVITYSKAAAQEMEKRFANLFAPNPAPPVTFGTFHSVFFRMLRQSKNLSLDTILNEGERRQLVSATLTKMEYSMDEEFISNVLTEMSLVRNELHDLTHYHSATIGADDFRTLCKTYELYKQERNKIDFDDMLCHMYVHLKNSPATLEHWQNRYPYIMIDEFQDINSVQYESIKLLAAKHQNLFIVGDDDQSIYRFRGSRPEFLLNFPNDFPNTEQVTLAINYRSTDEIIKCANNLISDNKIRYIKQIQGTGRAGAKPLVLIADDQNAEAVKIAERIRNLWKKGANLDEIVVTYRLNMQARAFMDAFINMNIPYRNRDEMPTIYEHWIAQDIFAYIRLAKRLALRQKVGFCADTDRVINKPFRYISKALMQSLKKENQDLFRVYPTESSLHLATKTKLEELHSDLLKLAKADTVDAIRFIRKEIGYNGYITDICEYRKLNPIGMFEIIDELQEAAKPFPNPEDFMNHATEITQAVREKADTGPCCTLTTLHSAKGLEFERVFIAGVVEEVIPSIRSKTEAEIEEERRLLYVGITRAKHELYISTIKSRYDKPTKPSRFITKK